MRTWITWIGVGALVASCGAVSAQEPRETPAAAISQVDPGKLVQTLCGQVKERLANMLAPQLVFETQTDWDHQAQIPSVQGFTLIQVKRNHGDWQKAKIVVREVPQRLKVNVGWLSSTADNRLSFAVHVVLPARAELHQQIWQNGLQVFAEHIESRFELSAHLQMEAELLPASKDGPSSVRLALVDGTYACDNFVADNINGLGGDFARLLDTGAGRTFRPWQPAILNEFQKEIAHAVSGAGDKTEVQACLGNLVQHANSVRAAAMQSPFQSTAIAAAVAPSTPLAVPVCINTSIELGISSVTRVAVAHGEAHVGAPHIAAAHVGKVVHPALTHFAVHVAHAAIASAAHIHVDTHHKK